MRVVKFLILCALGLCEACGKIRPKASVSAQLEQESTNISLETAGTVPSWLSGTLVRNGPVTVTVDGKTNFSWLDGLAMLHAFSFKEGKVFYTNQFLRTDAYKAVFKEGSLHYSGFAVDPCRSRFKNFFTEFFPSSHTPVHNANVNVAKFGEAYVALTEIPLPVEFDRKTLDTLGVFNYADELPKDKCWESAHPHYDWAKKSVLNYLIQYGRTSTYTLYNMEQGSSERKAFARVPVEQPAYMHSFAVTEHYVLLSEFPFVVNPLSLMTSGKPFIYNFKWEPERGTNVIVIDRQNGNVVGRYKTRPFFAFHHAGAFEQDEMIHFDIVTFKDASVITGKGLLVDDAGASPEEGASQLERFSLSLKTGEISSAVLLEESCEFPRIKESLDGLPHQFVYLTGFGKATDPFESSSLYKVNTSTKEVLEWVEEGCAPGEPIFVAAPSAQEEDAQEEDKGVVMTIVVDHPHKSSFLLILDGKTFKEIARAKAPYLIPKGLHGYYFE